MRTLPTTSALAVLLALTIAACESAAPTQPTPGLTVADFPMKVGTHWIYYVVDTMSGEQDTVDVRIVNEQIESSGKRVTTWIYASRNDVFTAESVFVSVLFDTVWYFSVRSFQPYRKIVFPIVSGAFWLYLSPRGVDSCTVASQEVIVTPYETVRAYRIETVTRPVSLSYVSHSTIWLAMNVGDVQSVQSEGWFLPDTVLVSTLLDLQ